ncbi:MAG: proton-conducting transporter membrane subunit [Chloroflexota bacterium]
MNAPVLWIVIPLAAGAIIFLIIQPRIAAIIGGTLAAMLALIALFVPIDTALTLGPVSFKLSSTLEVLGRSFVLGIADGPLLALIYGLAALWFFGTEAAGVASRFVALGLAIIALLVASIAVEPFLFAALLLEIASLLVVPLLILPYQPPKRGALRFLIYQTLAMPFILISGWMLAGVEASPGDLAMTTQSSIMLGLGFAFLLAIFPLYNWIPMLAEEASPYALGFLLWALPAFTTIFALGFLDRYAWLRTSPQLTGAIKAAGLIMVASGGIFAAFQRHLGRLMGYASIVGTGMLILAISLGTLKAAELVFLLLIARGLELAVWSLGISTLKLRAETLRFSAVQGLARAYPFAVAAVVLASLSMVGFPLLAGFPSRLALWEELARRSLFDAFWILIGLLGLLIGSVRTLAVLAMAPEGTEWKRNESWLQTAMLGIGVLGLFLLGLFPQVLQPFLAGLPVMFQHIGQ